MSGARRSRVTSAVRSFNATARRFCALLERPRSRPTLRRLQLELLDLYAAGARLPRRPGTPPLAGGKREVEMASAWENLLRPERYFEVFDATLDRGVISGWLYDDVRDIHLDLQRALGEGDAAFSFRTHWGAHCADALRALHWKLIGMNP